jgi:hypothetical protein
MPQYLLSVHTVEGEAREPMTDEEMQQSWAQISALNEELKSAGAWVFAGALHPPDTATVVRMSDGEVLTTDGALRGGEGASRRLLRHRGGGSRRCARLGVEGQATLSKGEGCLVALLNPR